MEVHACSLRGSTYMQVCVAPHAAVGMLNDDFATWVSGWLGPAYSVVWAAMQGLGASTVALASLCLLLSIYAAVHLAHCELFWLLHCLASQ